LETQPIINVSKALNRRHNVPDLHEMESLRMHFGMVRAANENETLYRSGSGADACGHIMGKDAPDLADLAFGPVIATTPVDWRRGAAHIYGVSATTCPTARFSTFGAAPWVTSTSIGPIAASSMSALQPACARLRARRPASGEPTSRQALVERSRRQIDI
jgi:hypothetical protein